MDKKIAIKRNKPFKGRLHAAIHSYVGNDHAKLAENFWHSDAIKTAVENADNATKSLRVLQKHLPERFHTFIRFAQPNLTWYLNVEKGTTATQLNMLLDELLLRITKDIGYAPRMKVAVQPSHQHWIRSGFPLKFEKKWISKLPSPDEAQAILDEFIKK